jgi:hypothetical protein
MRWEKYFVMAGMSFGLRKANKLSAVEASASFHSSTNSRVTKEIPENEP